MSSTDKHSYLIVKADDNDSDWISIDVNNVNNHTVRSRKMKATSTKWHQHDDSDEMFIVLDGSMIVEIENRPSTVLVQGDTFVVRKLIMHRVIVADFVHLLVIDQL